MEVNQQQITWMRQVRSAWRQVHEKKQARHITRHCPWSWKLFRGWFEVQHSRGVALKIHHLNQGDWQELMRACRRGMMLPDTAPF